MKRFTTSLATIVTGMMLVAGAQAADIAKLPMPNKAATTTGANIPALIAPCPTPYANHTEGVDTTKGEHYCLKANIGCPSGFTGSMDPGTGKMICTPIVTATCPAGWKGGVVDGKLVCDSIPQPTIPCKYSDGNGYTGYYKESWNKMGCTYRVVPK